MDGFELEIILSMKANMKIVITGGPSAGKTSVIEILHRTTPESTVAVPEAASILFRGGFPRQNEEAHLICQQKAIYYVQKQLEEIGKIESAGNKAIICDRGSLDGLAYWPTDAEFFFDEIDSSLAEEIARYDWVIHMDTAKANDYKLNDVRVEHNSLAIILNEKVKQAWSEHPRRIIIPHHTHFLVKLDTVIKVVNMILTGAEADVIRRSVG